MKHIMRFAHSVLRIASTHGTAALILCAVVMSIAKIGGRYGIGRYIASTLEELSIYALIWMIFLGMVLADREGQHIRVELLTQIASPAWRRRLGRVRDAAQAVIALGLAWLSVASSEFSMSIGERSVSMLAAPIWIVMLIMPVSFLALALVSAERALNPVGLAGDHPDGQEQST